MSFTINEPSIDLLPTHCLLYDMRTRSNMYHLSDLILNIPKIFQSIYEQMYPEADYLGWNIFYVLSMSMIYGQQQTHFWGRDLTEVRCGAISIFYPVNRKYYPHTCRDNSNIIHERNFIAWRRSPENCSLSGECILQKFCTNIFESGYARYIQWLMVPVRWSSTESEVYWNCSSLVTDTLLKIQENSNDTLPLFEIDGSLYEILALHFDVIKKNS